MFLSCEGKASCSFKADATLGDPCPGYGKFTSICYNCISSTQGGALVLFISFCICKYYIGGKQTNTYGWCFIHSRVDLMLESFKWRVIQKLTRND